STADQRARVQALDLVVPFAAGEEMRTEVSAKFRRDGVAAELAAAGFELRSWQTDPDGQFALSLSVPADVEDVHVKEREVAPTGG
ncbi:MAG TPA: L-histidine N(alpha)-methyltransferase, partial [Streptosporangiaceae bacterium]|nr:L-histidine N(alpha)-methyltransferase [Streptosporangiaceae bacterium]